MSQGPNIAVISALIGDPARATMLMALMAGKALTAGELANEAGITPQTASAHLARLEDAGLILRYAQGRHRYFALANQKTIELLELLMDITASTFETKKKTGPKDEALRRARICYDHLAGGIAVALLDRFIERKFITITDQKLLISEAARPFFEDFKIDMDRLGRAKRPICRSCMDWSERRPHLAGGLGAALFSRFQDLNWVRREGKSRLVTVTPIGLRELPAWAEITLR
ncbi:MAG: winged helix-turn-helix domain-containing protein [Pseudomonadota bacterium]